MTPLPTQQMTDDRARDQTESDRREWAVQDQAEEKLRKVMYHRFDVLALDVGLGWAIYAASVETAHRSIALQDKEDLHGARLQPQINLDEWIGDAADFINDLMDGVIEPI